MKHFILTVLTASVLLVTSARPATATTIFYTATDLPDGGGGDDLWQYQYLVTGTSFPLDFGFDIFFLLSAGYIFGDLQADPPEPNPDWDVTSIQPDSLLPHDGFLDALALVNNASITDFFIIEFIWRGSGTPGSQPFDIFDNTFAVIESGFTQPLPVDGVIPEPATVTLVGTGLLGLVVMKKRARRGMQMDSGSRAARPE